MSGASSPSAAAYTMRGLKANGHEKQAAKGSNSKPSYFQMPLHYPRYKKSDYESMPEWKLDCLLNEYGLPIMGDVTEKRKFAMGAFLWPNQLKE